MEEPNFLIGDFFGAGDCNFENHNQFIIDDLLVDFPNHDDIVLNDTFFDNVIGNSADSSAVTAVDSCDSSVSGNGSSRSLSDSQFSGVGPCGPCLQYDNMAEMKRLASFTEESFSIVEVKNLHIISASTKNPATDTHTSSSDSTPAVRSVTTVDSCNSSISGSELPFSGNIESRFSGDELRLPRFQYNDMADLERLSSFTFTQEAFSIVDLKTTLNISAAKKTPATDTSYSGTTPEIQQNPVHTPHTSYPNTTNSQKFQPDVYYIHRKPRSKRSRTAPYDWTSRILHLNQSFTNTIKTKPIKTPPVNRTDRKCLHCGSDTTPQWRSGPMGPKTLCNACGVRYQSGRLVPEYRPAASPTFVPAKHSNSHRKVMEIRRQKEVRSVENGFGNRGSGLGGSDGGDDCLIDRQCGVRCCT